MKKGAAVFKDVRIAADVGGQYVLRAASGSRKVCWWKWPVILLPCLLLAQQSPLPDSPGGFNFYGHAWRWAQQSTTFGMFVQIERY